MLNYQRVPTKSIPFRFSLGIQSTRTVLASPLVTCSTIDDMKQLQPRLSTIDALMTPTYRCSWHICIYVCLCSHPSHQKKQLPLNGDESLFYLFGCYFIYIFFSLSLSLSLCAYLIPKGHQTQQDFSFFHHISMPSRALEDAEPRLYNGS